MKYINNIINNMYKKIFFNRYWSKSSMQRSVSGRMGETTPSSHRVSFIGIVS